MTERSAPKVKPRRDGCWCPAGFSDGTPSRPIEPYALASGEIEAADQENTRG